MAAELVRLVSREDDADPEWASPEAQRAAAHAAALLRQDAMRLVEAGKRHDTAQVLSVAPRVLQRWIAGGGWLNEERPSLRVEVPAFAPAQVPQVAPQRPQAASAEHGKVRVVECVRERLVAAIASDVARPWCFGRCGDTTGRAGVCADDQLEARASAEDALGWLTVGEGDLGYTWVARLNNASSCLAKARSLESPHDASVTSWGDAWSSVRSLAGLIAGPPLWVGDIGPLARLAWSGDSGCGEAAEGMARETLEAFARLGDPDAAAPLVPLARAAARAPEKYGAMLTVYARSLISDFGVGLPRSFAPPT